MKYEGLRGLQKAAVQCPLPAVMGEPVGERTQWGGEGAGRRIMKTEQTGDEDEVGPSVIAGQSSDKERQLYSMKALAV